MRYDSHTVSKSPDQGNDVLTWKAGMLIPSNASGRSSMSTLQNTADPFCSLASSSNTGAIFWHGLHQLAVKSTITSGPLLGYTQQGPRKKTRHNKRTARTELSICDVYLALTPRVIVNTSLSNLAMDSHVASSLPSTRYNFSLCLDWQYFSQSRNDFLGVHRHLQ